MEASRVCMCQMEELFVETGVTLSDIKLFGADIGPGSFTGVRVGVTLAKTLAMTQDKMCIGATSFDLINRTGTAMISAKKGFALVRNPGEQPVMVPVTESLIHPGYLPGKADSVYPNAAKAAEFLGELQLISPVDFLPDYVFEPSISQAKNPIIMGGSSA